MSKQSRKRQPLIAVKLIVAYDREQTGCSKNTVHKYGQRRIQNYGNAYHNLWQLGLTIRDGTCCQNFRRSFSFHRSWFAYFKPKL